MTNAMIETTDEMENFNFKVGDLLRLKLRYYEEIAFSFNNLLEVQNKIYYFKRLEQTNTVPAVMIYTDTGKRGSEMDKKRFLIVDKKIDAWILMDLQARIKFIVETDKWLNTAFKQATE